MFQLIRYVPDLVRNEFVNIGVLLHECRSHQSRPELIDLRFTQNWRRVLSLYPQADTAMLKEMESDLRNVLQNDHGGPVAKILDSLSLNIQTTEPKAYLAVNPTAAIEELMHLYVD